MDQLEYFYEYLPNELVNSIKHLDDSIIRKLTEIRIRKDKPVMLSISNSSYCLCTGGKVSKKCYENAVYINDLDFEQILLKLCDYSIYSKSEELKSGYLTLKNGARIGACGTGVYNCDELIGINDITSLNIRIPRQAIGCSYELLEKLIEEDMPSIIVAGKPNSGKTTLIRDIARSLSNGDKSRMFKVSIVDERNEIAGKCKDSYSLDVGINTDVITGLKKWTAIEIALRSLSPEVIICDEISGEESLERIKFGFSCGVKFVLTIHVGDIEDLYKKSIVRDLLQTESFKKVVYISDNYQVKIIDSQEILYEINRRNIDF